MPLATGTKLGPYEIQSALGAGGMGEVYKARDTRLDRTVAIKILPDALAVDPQFRARFDREARTISQLDHPHICALYDVGEQDGTAFLVMQYQEGETLEARLKKGALALDQALQCAIQIADALDKAHRAGIVHRDLKPGNIMLTKAGAKLLDFGLAKTGAPMIGGAGLSMLPTTQPNMTVEGTILGTFQYMAPEQLEGHEADARTDIFAFGAVLYEMLTGKKAFEGKSQASLIAAILERDPPPIAPLNPLTPLALERVVKTCLAKDPEERWQTARDLKRELAWVTTSEITASAVTRAEARRSRSRGLLYGIAWAVAGLTTGIAFMAAFVRFEGKVPEPTAVQFAMLPPDQTTFVSGPPFGSLVAVSPDGRRVVMVAAGKDGRRRLWVRPLDGLGAQVLAGTEDGYGPFWSPDSQWIAFFASNKLKRVAASGGEVQTVCECQSGCGGGTWNRGNVILFAPAVAGESGLFRVPAGGGSPARVTTLDVSHRETNHASPHFLPDGRHFLYMLAGGGDRAGIYAGSLDSSERVRLLTFEDLGNEFSTVAYAPPGYLLFVRSGVLLAQPFDLKRLVLTGESVRIAEGVYKAGPGSAAFSVSANGVLAYWSGATPGNRQLTWVRRDGTRIATVGGPAAYANFSIAPDGRRVAMTRYEPGEKSLPFAVWLVDLQRGTPTKFTFNSGAGSPVWSPDGARLVFATGGNGPPGLHAKPTNAVESGDDQLLAASVTNEPTDWSADGQSIVYEVLDDRTKNDLWLLPLSDVRRAVPLRHSRANETSGRISPDRRWMAYTSDESGREEIFVTNFPEPRGKWLISTNGGAQPEWRRDSRELFYRSPDRKLMAVSIGGTATLEAGTPQPLFEMPANPRAWLQGGGDQRVYAPSADGQRFLIGVPIGEEAATPITVVLNWTATLKQ